MNHSAPLERTVKIGILIFMFFILLQPLWAELIMDSEDSLAVAEFTAFDKAHKGYFKDALKAESDALKIQIDRDGPTHPSQVPILEDMASLDRYLALYEEAESALKWGLAIREKAFGSENPLTAESLHQLASLYLDWGHWQDAQYYESKALIILEPNSTGPLFENLCPSLKTMGQVKLGLAQPGEALLLFNQCLRLEEKDSLSSPQERIDLLNLLAKTSSGLNQFSQAQSCFEKALSLSKDHFKAQSIEVADAKENLADFLHFRKEDSQAAVLYQEAFDIDKGFVGTTFSYPSLFYVQKLAKIDESLGHFKEAVDLLQKSLPAEKEAYGAVHPRVAVGLLDLAQAQEGLGLKALAQSNLQEALRIAQSFYREDAPIIKEIQKKLHP